MTIWQSAYSTVQKGRVSYIGQGRNCELYEVGEGDNKISIRLSAEGIPRVLSCTCKSHSVKDIYCIGYCSAVLAVLYYKVRNS